MSDLDYIGWVFATASSEGDYPPAAGEWTLVEPPSGETITIQLPTGPVEGQKSQRPLFLGHSATGASMTVTTTDGSTITWNGVAVAGDVGVTLHFRYGLFEATWDYDPPDGSTWQLSRVGGPTWNVVNAPPAPGPFAALDGDEVWTEWPVSTPPQAFGARFRVKNTSNSAPVLVTATTGSFEDYDEDTYDVPALAVAEFSCEDSGWRVTSTNEWVFRPEQFGAQGDGVNANDAQISLEASTEFISASLQPFSGTRHITIPDAVQGPDVTITDLVAGSAIGETELITWTATVGTGMALPFCAGQPVTISGVSGFGTNPHGTFVLTGVPSDMANSPSPASTFTFVAEQPGSGSYTANSGSAWVPLPLTTTISCATAGTGTLTDEATRFLGMPVEWTVTSVMLADGVCTLGLDGLGWSSAVFVGMVVEVAGIQGFVAAPVGSFRVLQVDQQVGTIVFAYDSTPFDYANNAGTGPGYYQGGGTATVGHSAFWYSDDSAAITAALNAAVAVGGGIVEFRGVTYGCDGAVAYTPTSGPLVPVVLRGQGQDATVLQTGMVASLAGGSAPSLTTLQVGTATVIEDLTVDGGYIGGASGADQALQVSVLYNPDLFVPTGTSPIFERVVLNRVTLRNITQCNFGSTDQYLGFIWTAGHGVLIHHTVINDVTLGPWSNPFQDAFATTGVSEIKVDGLTCQNLARTPNFYSFRQLRATNVVVRDPVGCGANNGMNWAIIFGETAGQKAVVANLDYTDGFAIGQEVYAGSADFEATNLRIPGQVIPIVEITAGDPTLFTLAGSPTGGLTVGQLVSISGVFDGLASVTVTTSSLYEGATTLDISGLEWTIEDGDSIAVYDGAGNVTTVVAAETVTAGATTLTVDAVTMSPEWTRAGSTVIGLDPKASNWQLADASFEITTVTTPPLGQPPVQFGVALDTSSATGPVQFATAAARLDIGTCGLHLNTGDKVGQPKAIISNSYLGSGGAGIEQAAERPIVEPVVILELAEAITPRLRALVLLAGFGGLRSGEMLALTRADVDLVHKTVQIRASAAEITGAGQVVGGPKSEAGHRTVALPGVAAAALDEHLSIYAAAGVEGVVFTGKRGGPMRRAELSEEWRKAVAKVASAPGDLHVHDLRHAAATMIARMPGVTTKELMSRIGHSSPRAALIYQHATAERDQAIADFLDEQVAAAKTARSKSRSASIVPFRRT